MAVALWLERQPAVIGGKETLGRYQVGKSSQVSGNSRAERCLDTAIGIGPAGDGLLHEASAGRGERRPLAAPVFQVGMERDEPIPNQRAQRMG